MRWGPVGEEASGSSVEATLRAAAPLQPGAAGRTLSQPPASSRLIFPSLKICVSAQAGAGVLGSPRLSLCPSMGRKCRLGENRVRRPGTSLGCRRELVGRMPEEDQVAGTGHADAPRLENPLPPLRLGEEAPMYVTVEAGLSASLPPGSFFFPPSSGSSFSLLLPFSLLFLSLLSPLLFSPFFSPVSLPHSLSTLRDPSVPRLDAAAGRICLPRPRSPPLGGLCLVEHQGWAEDGAVV